MLQVFGINGRINRLTWWIVQLGLFTLSYIIRLFFSPTLPSGRAEWQALLANEAQLQALGQQYMSALPVFLVSGIFTHWLFVTSSVQRLHDRDSSGWRVIFAYVPYLVIIVSLCNIFARGSLSVSILGLIMGVIGFLMSYVWLIVECGILPGDESSNDYGDPVGAASRRAQLNEELQAMMGGPIATDAYEPVRSSASPAPQPTMSFASTAARPSFGKR